jgi:hypothetical protein
MWKGKGPSVPSWLTVVDGALQPIPAEVAKIEQVFRDAIAGYSVADIAKRFGRKVAGAWVHAVLTDRRVLGEHRTKSYIGKRGTKTGEVRQAYPRIIDEDTFNAAAGALSSRRGKVGRRGKTVNVFRGLVHHADGATMILTNKANKGRSYPYLVSSAGKAKLPGGILEFVPYPAFEQAVLHWLKNELDLSLLGDDHQAVSLIVSKKGRLEIVRKELAELADELANQGFSRLLASRVRDLEAEEEGLEAEVKTLEGSQYRPQIADMKELIAKLPSNPELLTKVAQAVRMVIRRIDLRSEKESRYNRRFYLVVDVGYFKAKIWFSTVRGEFQTSGTWWTADGKDAGSSLAMFWKKFAEEHADDIKAWKNEKEKVKLVGPCPQCNAEIECDEPDGEIAHAYCEKCNTIFKLR